MYNSNVQVRPLTKERGKQNAISIIVVSGVLENEVSAEKRMLKLLSYFCNSLVFLRMKEIISVGKRQLVG